MRFQITIYLSFLFTVFFNPAFSGEDEKLKEILSQKSSPTEKSRLLLNQAQKYRYSSPETGLKYSRMADSLNLAAGNADPVQMALAKEEMGIAYREMGDNLAAKKVLEDGIEILNASERTDSTFLLQLAGIQTTLGSVFRRMADNESAISLYQKSITILDDLKKRYPEKESLNLQLAKTMTNISIVFSVMGQGNTAHAYLLKALKLQKAETESKLFTYFNLGSSFLNNQDYDSAIWYFNKAVTPADSVQNSNIIRSSLHNIGIVYQETGRYEKAIEYFEKALKISKARNLEAQTAQTIAPLSKVYIELGKYDKAEALIMEGMSLDKSNIGSRLSLHENLSRLYEIKQDYVRALAEFKTFQILSDSLYNLTQSQTVSEMEARFQNERKEKELILQQQEIELLNKDNKIRRLWLNLFGLIFLLLFAGGTLVVRNKNFKIKKNLEIYQANQALSQANLENSRLKELELQKELEHRNQQLTSFTLNFIQKSELLSELKETVNELQQKAKLSNQDFVRMKKLMQQHGNIDKDWNNFKLYFENVHREFFIRLNQYFPDLTPNELKLSALIRLNLNIKESALILGISPESVKTARYRLRKKLNLEQETSILNFFLELEQAPPATAAISKESL